MDKELFNFQKNALAGNINGQPLCNSFKAAWRSCGDDKEMLVRLALSQQAIPYVSHACYENLGVTKEYILENYGEYINGNKVFYDVEGVQGYSYMLYVAFNGVLEVSADVLSLMWCNDTSVEIKTSKCPVLYLSNDSHVTLNLEGFNSPRIYLFDTSSVTIEDADKNSEVIVYKYSSRAEVSTGKFCFGVVKEFNKQLRL